MAEHGCICSWETSEQSISIIMQFYNVLEEVQRKRSLPFSSPLIIVFVQFADLLARDLEYLASLESLDNGKTYVHAVYDVHASISAIRYTAGWCDKIRGDTIPAGTSYLSGCFAYFIEY